MGRGSTPDPCQRAPLQPIGFRLRWEPPKEVPWLPCSSALAAKGLLASGVIRVTPGTEWFRNPAGAEADPDRNLGRLRYQLEMQHGLRRQQGEIMEPPS